MTITSLAQATQEINATNLSDGQQIKQILLDLITFVSAGAALDPQAGPAELTDSTGGTAGATLAAITAGGSYAQADMTAAKNAIASLNAQINALMTKLVAAGVLTAV